MLDGPHRSQSSAAANAIACRTAHRPSDSLPACEGHVCRLGSPGGHGAPRGQARAARTRSRGGGPARRSQRSNGQPILHDLYLSHVLASARDGLGVSRLDLVDIGIEGRERWPEGFTPGFAELRGDTLNSTAQPYPRGLRVVHVGCGQLLRYAPKRWPHGPCERALQSSLESSTGQPSLSCDASAMRS